MTLHKTFHFPYIEDDHVALSWREEKDHVTRVPLEFLRRHCYSKEVLEKRDMDSRPKTYSQVFN